MTPFQSLLRITLKQNFSLKRMLGQNAAKSKWTTGLLLGAILYALGAFLASFGYLFFLLGEGLSQMDMIEFLLLYIGSYASGLAIMFSLFRANGSLFHFRDYEILAPMPLTTLQMVAVKLIVMMINLYVSILIMVSPILFSYFWFAPVGILNALYLILGFFFLPMIPVALFSFASMIVARITAMFRRNSLLNILVMFIFFFGIMVFSLSISSQPDVNPFLGQLNAIQGIGVIYLPMIWFQKAVHEADLLSLLWLILSSGGIFALFVWGLSATIMKTNSVTMTTRTSGKTKAVVYEQNHVVNALITKEFRKFFHVPIYALNCGFGLVMMLIAGVASLVAKEELMGLLAQMGAVGLETPLLLLVFEGFCLSTVYTSAISLSLEGKNFWVLKSLPLEPTAIMNAKMLFNVLMGTGCSLFATVLFSIAFQFNVGMMLIMILVSSTLSWASSVLGSIINLRAPKFDYANDTEIVKQSMGALLGMFGGFLILVADGALYYGLSRVLDMEWCLLLIASVNALLAIFLSWRMRRATESLFMKLPA